MRPHQSIQAPAAQGAQNLLESEGAWPGRRHGKYWAGKGVALIRRTVVIVLVLAAFGLIIWAGVVNYRVREAKKIAANSPGQQLTLTPQGVATPADGSDAGTSATPPAGTQADSDQPGSADTGLPPNPLLGRPAPAFSLVDTQGKRVSLADYKGKPVMVNFWATWCGPCKFEIPWLTALQTQYAPKGFQILGISSDQLDPDAKSKADEQKAAIIAAAQKLHINYPVLYGGDTISQLYGGIDLLPQSFYINRKGIVVAVITGAGSKGEAESDIKKALQSGS
jgi:thiol-disulfide isomerase/thioredoxin